MNGKVNGKANVKVNSKVSGKLNGKVNWKVKSKRSDKLNGKLNDKLNDQIAKRYLAGVCGVSAARKCLSSCYCSNYILCSLYCFSNYCLKLLPLKPLKTFRKRRRFSATVRLVIRRKVRAREQRLEAEVKRGGMFSKQRQTAEMCCIDRPCS